MAARTSKSRSGSKTAWPKKSKSLTAKQFILRQSEKLPESKVVLRGAEFGLNFTVNTVQRVRREERKLKRFKRVSNLAKKARLARVQQNSALNLSSVEEMERALVSLMLAVGLSRTRELMRELVYELQGDTALLSTIFRSDDE